MKHRTSEKEGEESASSRDRKGDRDATSNATSDRVASLQRAVGNQAVQRLAEEGRIQPKLSVSQPDDAHEREADRVADAVMRMPSGRPGVDRTASAGIARSIGPSSGSVPAVQRQPAGGGGSEFDSYTVQSGDSLWAIANRFGVRGGHQRIAELNDMAVDDVIHPGDTLKLPAGSVQGGGSGSGGSGGGGGGGGSGGGGGGSGDGSGSGGGGGGSGSSGSASGGSSWSSVDGWLLVDEAGEAVGEAAGWVVDLFSPENGDGGDPSGNRLVYEHEVSDAFTRKVRRIASNLGADPNHLMAIMAFETGGSFDPAQENAAGSGATGLIQFMPSTAESLGTSTGELAEMSAVRQLDYVAQYFEPYKGDLNSVDDFYMAVLWPAAVGESEEYVLFERGTTAYEQNSGLDDNEDGTITKREAAGKVRNTLARGRQLLETDPSAAAESGSSQEQSTYVVQEGESLAVLSEKHGVSVEALKAANPDKLKTWGDVQGFNAGATIVIPSSGREGASGSGGDGEMTWEEIRRAWAEAGEGMVPNWLLDQLSEEEGAGSGGTGDGGGGGEQPQWIQVAFGEEGRKERGPDEGALSDEQKTTSNPEIEKYHASAGLTAASDYHAGNEDAPGVGDHVPWCGAFVNWCIEQAGHSGPRGAGGASNWEGWGQTLDEPAYGAVAVVRGGGHVGFVVGKSGGSIQLLGGNQGDEVNVSTYSTGSATYYGLPSGYDTSTLPTLGDVEAREGGDTR